MDTPNRLYSLLSIFGLALGLACCLLLAVFVDDELRVGDFHSKADRVHRVLWRSEKTGSTAQFSAGTDGGLTPAMVAEFPERILFSDEDRAVRRSS